MPLVWYGRPVVAYASFLPAATAGLLAPYALAPAASAGGATPAARSVGAALLFSMLCSGLTAIGMHHAFFYGIWAAGAALAAALLGTGGGGGSRGGGGWGRPLALMTCFAGPVAIALPSAVTFAPHIMEKASGGGWVLCV